MHAGALYVFVSVREIIYSLELVRTDAQTFVTITSAYIKKEKILVVYGIVYTGS